MKTLVFGASLNKERYSNIALNMLLDYSHEVLAIGGRAGEIRGIEILTGHPVLENIHTITMYMGEQRQEEHISYLMGLKPKRIIFNPGAENPAFERKLLENNIEVIRACTLVLLRTGQYDPIQNSDKVKEILS